MCIEYLDRCLVASALRNELLKSLHTFTLLFYTIKFCQKQYYIGPKRKYTKVHYFNILT